MLAVVFDGWVESNRELLAVASFLPRVAVRFLNRGSEEPIWEGWRRQSRGSEEDSQAGPCVTTL